MYTAKFPAMFIIDYEFSITHYKLINILVALRVWGQVWQHKRVVFKVDNLAVVTICNCGYTRCKDLVDQPVCCDITDHLFHLDYNS